MPVLFKCSSCGQEHVSRSFQTQDQQTFDNVVRAGNSFTETCPVNSVSVTYDDSALSWSNLAPEEKARLMRALEERRATAPCPRCAHTTFSVLDGYFSQVIQTQLPALVLGGPIVPFAIIVCMNCGFMSQHALGVLNLLPASLSSKGGAK